MRDVVVCLSGPEVVRLRCETCDVVLSPEEVAAPCRCVVCRRVTCDRDCTFGVDAVPGSAIAAGARTEPSDPAKTYSGFACPDCFREEWIHETGGAS